MTLQRRLTPLMDVRAGQCEVHQIFVIDLVEDLLEQLIGYIEQERHVRNEFLQVDKSSVTRQTNSITNLKTLLCDLTLDRIPNTGPTPKQNCVKT